MAVTDEESGSYDDQCSDNVVIIDNGSGRVKCGFSKDEDKEKPRAILPACIGVPRKKYANQMEEFLAGEEMIENRSKLTTHYPLEHGIIQNFEHMELLWEYVIDEVLQVENIRETPMLLTEPPYNPKNTRERIVEVMFETFEVPELNMSVQGVLALLGMGRTTGCVLDVGDGVSHTIPVYGGFGLPHCMHRLDLGGRDLEIFLAKMIASSNEISLATSSEKDHVRKMKEELCYVSKDPSSEVAELIDYRLPDGREIHLGDERWKVPEALFQPQFLGMETGSGLGGLVWDTVQKTELDVRPAMLANIAVSGGTTLFRNFPARLHKELCNFAPISMASRIKILAQNDRDFAVYKGAMTFANLKNMQPENWMTLDEYVEHGPSLIHDKQQMKYS